MKPLPFAILTVMLTGWGLFAVHQRVLATRHGYMVQHLQEERRVLVDDNQKLECEIAALTRPDRIARAVRAMGLEIVDPVALTRPDSAHRSEGHASQTGVAPQQTHAAN